MNHQIVGDGEMQIGSFVNTVQVGASEDTVTLRNGWSVRVRRVSPTDAEAIQEFVRRLSDTTRRLRFFTTIRELSPSMLAHFTQSAGSRGQVLLAEAHDGGTWHVVALAEYAAGDDSESCELALVVADAWQRLGLGHALMGVLIRAAHGARFVRAAADVMCCNEAMLALSRAYDFAVARSPLDSTIFRLERNLLGGLQTDRTGTPAWSASQAHTTAVFALRSAQHQRSRAATLSR